ncbi:cysteine--tRNA ligase [Acetobacter orientalis]|uniref:Cysteine--tRNA ligase n=1 Tax=Acetobacter orientalis TaxID=146474 RepID=A0A2Z5ZHS4_9PROT|nr:cysteine--tRNA ligase [Acetobacter orientalis]
MTRGPSTLSVRADTPSGQPGLCGAVVQGSQTNGVNTAPLEG